MLFKKYEKEVVITEPPPRNSNSREILIHRYWFTFARDQTRGKSGQLYKAQKELYKCLNLPETIRMRYVSRKVERTEGKAYLLHAVYIDWLKVIVDIVAAVITVGCFVIIVPILIKFFWQKPSQRTYKIGTVVLSRRAIFCVKLFILNQERSVSKYTNSPKENSHKSFLLRPFTSLFFFSHIPKREQRR